MSCEVYSDGKGNYRAICLHIDLNTEDEETEDEMG